ncbi:MAG TPA: Hsp20/alpha crystallin family protein [Usitatibacter sp.]|nr:Hsp20/alpha crystallin family protein [Usitatibacter sp.]
MYSTRPATLSALDGLLNEFLRPAPAWDNAAVDTLPLRVDVREQPDAYIFYADVPGVKKDDIHIEIERNEVTLRAEARAEAPAAEAIQWLRRERRASRAERRFVLPVEVDEAAAAAKLADGVLQLTLPKKATATARKIAVN